METDKQKFYNMTPELTRTVDNMIEDAFEYGHCSQIDLSHDSPGYGGKVKCKVIVIPLEGPQVEMVRREINKPGVSHDPDPNAN